MPAPRKFSDEVSDRLRESFHSDMSGPEVAREFGYDFHRTVRKFWIKEFGLEAYKSRISRLCRVHKIGTRNPMYGRTKERHPRYLPKRVACGYIHIEAPDWYTGTTDKGKAAEHILVACKEAGITQLPEGHVVHHKDEDKWNNSPDNLEIMSRGRHMAIHRWLRHEKKVQRLSREGVGPK